MNLSGAEAVSIPIEEVWSYLVDAKKVAACAPGFQGLEEIEPEHWKAFVSVGIGPVRARLMVDMTRPEMHEPDRMVVKAHGKAPGSAVEVVAKLRLIALDAGQTRMEWNASLVVRGTLASVGTRLMSSIVQKLTEQFFTCLKEHLQASAASGPSSSTQAEG